ncbi:MAG: F0F1 ATP synthase subunit B [Propionibacteriaceae bacterium]|jgi:F-type H+-transporting ATPase subunit b|nr:F0F1 ATP synthase subunit B [Propionibacteriaceae bacterium]
MVPLELDLGPLLPEHPSELVIGVVLFLVIVFVVAKKVVPSFEELYERRNAVTRGAIEDAERKQAEADAALARYNAQLAQAQDEAARIRDDARAAAADIRSTARQQAEDDAHRIQAGARAQLDADRAHALAELQGTVGGLATTLAGKILGESLTDDERARRAVDRFLADLDAPAKV